MMMNFSRGSCILKNKNDANCERCDWWARLINTHRLVVKDFAELDKRCEEARGRIVVWNLGGWLSYGANQPYRTEGASAAARCGGLASLSRSVGPYSLETPHTGSTSAALFRITQKQHPLRQFQFYYGTPHTIWVGIHVIP